MDEPCSAIDPKSTTAIEDLMNDLRKQYTIVIATHTMQQVARVSDFCAFLYQGVLVEFASTQKIPTNPDYEQTANYITNRFR